MGRQILCSDAPGRTVFQNVAEQAAFSPQVYGGGVAVAMLACVPDWPYFNTHSESWLPSQKDALKVAAGTKLVAAR